MSNPPNITKGYKVTDSETKCRGYQFELGKIYSHEGKIEICEAGFHFCLHANNCFNYYDFNGGNRVFEIEATGHTIVGDEKSVCSEIKLIREIPWEEVLRIVNTGKNNTGRGNSGDSNSGYCNSGDRNSGDSNSGNWNSGDSNSGYRNSGDSNSGDRNSGDSNSGYRNSGDWNSGDSNSGDRNSGNWNSGDRNSGDSNSGYRNSGAFCTDPNPTILLFDQPTKIKVKDWEQHPAVQLMYKVDPTIWVPSGMMSDQEKSDHPKYETTEGYLKKISMHEAWSNAWGNWSDESKAHFTSLPNFDKKKFEAITGIKIKS